MAVNGAASFDSNRTPTLQQISFRGFAPLYSAIHNLGRQGQASVVDERHGDRKNRETLRGGGASSGLGTVESRLRDASLHS